MIYSFFYLSLVTYSPTIYVSPTFIAVIRVPLAYVYISLNLFLELDKVPRNDPTDPMNRFEIKFKALESSLTN